MAAVYEPCYRKKASHFVTYNTMLVITLFNKQHRLKIVQRLLHKETLIERRLNYLLNYLFNTYGENNREEYIRTQLKMERADLISDIRSIQGEIELEKQADRAAGQFWL